MLNRYEIYQKSGKKNYNKIFASYIWAPKLQSNWNEDNIYWKFSAVFNSAVFEQRIVTQFSIRLTATHEIHRHFFYSFLFYVRCQYIEYLFCNVVNKTTNRRLLCIRERGTQKLHSTAKWNLSVSACDLCIIY